MKIQRKNIKNIYIFSFFDWSYIPLQSWGRKTHTCNIHRYCFYFLVLHGRQFHKFGNAMFILIIEHETHCYLETLIKCLMAQASTCSKIVKYEYDDFPWHWHCNLWINVHQIICSYGQYKFAFNFFISKILFEIVFGF